MCRGYDRYCKPLLCAIHSLIAAKSLGGQLEVTLDDAGNLHIDLHAGLYKHVDDRLLIFFELFLDGLDAHSA